MADHRALRMQYPLRLALVAFAVALDAGCSAPVASTPATQPKRVLVAAEKEAAEKERQTTPPRAEPAAEVIQEIWEETYLQGVKVGFAKTEVAKVREGDAVLIRLQQSAELHLKRDGQASDQQMSFTCWQTAGGRLVRFESQMDGGGTKVLASGKVEGDKLRTQTHTVGSTQRQAFDWEEDWGGYFAQDESLRNNPLKLGERRTIVGLTPMLNSPSATTLDAVDHELTKLRDTEQKLLKVRASTVLGDQSLESLLWINDQGEVLKTRLPGLGLETFRTTKSVATNMATIGNVDLLRATIVKPTSQTLQPGDFSNLATARRVVYRARIKEGNVARAFSDCLSQRLEVLDEHTARLAVASIRPDVPATLAAKSPGPTQNDLLPSSYIQSDDAEVTRLATSVAPDGKNPWKVACALEKFVDETITEKNFASALATAAEVARSKTGDCTEHAVLFAALCRSRKIPARVAFGLVYVKHLGGFAYHMWNEVWIEDRWIPMDATLGQGGIGCDHIKLGDSNLKGSDSLGAMASVAQVLNQLELEIVEVE